MKKVAVLGDGSWGTAIATVLAHNGHSVSLWCHNQDVKDSIEQVHINSKYLPNVTLSPSIIPTTSLHEALQGAEWVFEAIPVQFLRAVVSQIKEVNIQQKWVLLSKGIECTSLYFPAQILRDVLCNQSVSYALCYGPSYAYDVAHQQLTGLVIGSESQSLAQECAALLKNHFIHIQMSSDTIGLQVVAACKNSIALAVGICSGAGWGENTKALLYIRLLDEVKTVVEYYQGQLLTLYGLAGIGDSVLTAFGSQSRNVLIGTEIGKGKPLATALAQAVYVPESINTLAALKQMLQKYRLHVPLLEAVHGIVFEQKPLQSLKGVL